MQQDVACITCQEVVRCLPHLSANWGYHGNQMFLLLFFALVHSNKENDVL